jgi:hypothetical protein
MKLDPLDVNWCVHRLAEEVPTLLTDNPVKAAVAGGFIRSVIAGEEVKDIGIFVDSKEGVKNLSKNLQCSGSRPRRLIETDNVLSRCCVASKNSSKSAHEPQPVVLGLLRGVGPNYDHPIAFAVPPHKVTPCHYRRNEVRYPQHTGGQAEVTLLEVDGRTCAPTDVNAALS